MGRTLFWYIFKDLLRIFFMASGALAGIMSFGGLLRPLTQQGLDAGQVGKMLSYFTPAMTAYSFPVAALFATTVVYGRMSADNELTACRAGGISLGPFFGMAFPAVVFGLIVAIVSLVFLCFIVPIYTLKAEKVIYENLAKLIANRIERTHQLELGEATTVFAQCAYLPNGGEKQPGGVQQVVLEDVSIATYSKAGDSGKPTTTRSSASAAAAEAAAADRSSDSGDSGLGSVGGDTSGKGDKRLKLPREFWTASSATVNIYELPNDQIEVQVGLEGGEKFPRDFRGGMQAGIGVGRFGPLEIPSPIKEDPKFMTVDRLKDLFDHPETSRKINGMTDGFLRRDQEQRFLEVLRDQLNSPTRQAVLSSGKETVTLTVVDAVSATIEGAAHGDEGNAGELAVSGFIPAAVLFERRGDQPSRQAAREMRLRVRPDLVAGAMDVTIELLQRAPGNSERPTSENYSDLISVPMPPELAKLKSRRLGDYFQERVQSTGKPLLTRGERFRLKREMTVLSNGILAESNSRASFAVSCLILVLVGAALGMMFRSGNFLTAFAVSFVPALLCITLIVSGQQTCHSVPWTENRANPLRLGLTLIWSGDVVNLILAAGLLWRLQRQ